MAFEDRTLVCKDCGKDFIFTAGEQEFYAQKGFTNDPTRCKDDRAKSKQQKMERQTEITCKNCGKTDMVNFKPRNPEDILCNECFMKQRDTVHSAHRSTEPGTDTPETASSEKSDEADKSMEEEKPEATPDNE